MKGTSSITLFLENIYIKCDIINSQDNINPMFILGTGIKTFEMKNISVEGKWSLNNYLLQGSFSTEIFWNQSSSSTNINIDCMRPAFAFLIPGICSQDLFSAPKPLVKFNDADGGRYYGSGPIHILKPSATVAWNGTSFDIKISKSVRDGDHSIFPNDCL